MERNFKNENFESFLKQNAEHLRMRPKEEVWKNISKSLNGRKRRYTIGLISFFLLVSLLGYIAIETSTTNKLPTADHTKKATNVSSAQTVTNSSATRSASSSVTGSVHSNLFGDKNKRTGSNFYSQSKVLEPRQNVVPELFAFESSIIDSDIEAEQQEILPFLQQPENKSNLLTIESLVNSYKAKTKKKLSFQFTFTPTISYRKLSENKSYLRSAGANLPSNYPALYNDVNSQVTHKPDMGFELGYTAKYALTNKLNLRAGLQLNVNRYAIKTFKSSTEIATIRLNSSNSRPDSLTTITNFNNYNGYQTNWLQNFYVQFSAPIGVEYIVKKSNNVNFGIATTLQPNYVVGDRAYIISSDYKNYSLVPSLTRKWNVATSFETFVGYSTGKLKWQVGPQVRYQLLSSFVDEYPVKENLFDFGLKVGISLNNQ